MEADDADFWPKFIRALLDALDWTEAELAREIGCSRAAVCRWVASDERRRRNPSGTAAASIVRLARQHQLMD